MLEGESGVDGPNYDLIRPFALVQFMLPHDLLTNETIDTNATNLYIGILIMRSPDIILLIYPTVYMHD